MLFIDIKSGYEIWIGIFKPAEPHSHGMLFCTSPENCHHSALKHMKSLFSHILAGMLSADQITAGILS